MAGPGEEAWKSHTTPFDRVRATVLAMSEPRSAEWVAEEAAVSVEVAKNHLDSLVVPVYPSSDCCLTESYITPDRYLE